MRIKEISFEGLFKIFNHTIPLNLDDRITIIHGPNGYGKTTILKLLDIVFAGGNPEKLYTTPFKKIKIAFDDGSRLEIDKEKEDIGSWKSRSEEDVVFRFWKSGSENEPDLWLLPKKRSDFPPKRKDIPLPLQLNNLLKSVKVHFVSTERLLKKEEEEVYAERRYRHFEESLKKEEAVYAKAVLYISDRLTNIIKTKLNDYAEISQALDRTFPLRLVKQISSTLTEQQIRDRLENLERKRSKLIDIGLLDKDESSQFEIPQHIEPDTINVLSIYVEDTEKKLAVFDQLADKIELMRHIINKHFLYKQLTIDRNSGFIFKTRNGESLELANLSSGEQHELVLLYKMLFEVDENSLVLIDEPEISLHVVWQQEFLDDMGKIINLAKFDLLIATHSPQIIHDRWDLTVELKGLVDEELLNIV